MLQYFLSICLVLLCSILWYKKWKENRAFWKCIGEIPGPYHYPLIGYTGVFTLSDGVKSFKRDRETARLYGPVFKIWFFNLAFALFTGPEDIEKILSNAKHNYKGRDYHIVHDLLGSGLLTSNGEKWQTRRKILTPAFHFSILQEFVSTFNKALDGLLKDLEEQCHKDYIEVNIPITKFTINAIGETSMGLNFSNDPRCELYRNAVNKYCRALSEQLPKAWMRVELLFSFTRLHKVKMEATDFLHKFSDEVIKDRQTLFKNGVISYTEKRRMAMLDLMLAAKFKGADISDEGIREEVDTFMFAGHDTTGLALSYALMVFANHQNEQEEAYKEIVNIVGKHDKNPTYSEINELKYLERCIKEVLRLYPSAPLILRVAGEDIKTSEGYTIPKGTSLGVLIYDLHRNPKVWEDPEKFDPDRFLPDNIAKRHPYAYIPFSAGQRNCLGQKYAMLELKTALCGILRRFKLEPVDTSEDIHFKPDLVLRPVRDIRVKFVPRVDF